MGQRVTALKPSDDAIVLAMGLLGERAMDSGLMYADEIRGCLHKLGFEATTQQVAAWLGRLSREDTPMVQAVTAHDHCWRWRLTRFGATQLGNHFSLPVGFPKVYRGNGAR